MNSTIAIATRSLDATPVAGWDGVFVPGVVVFVPVASVSDTTVPFVGVLTAEEKYVGSPFVSVGSAGAKVRRLLLTVLLGSMMASSSTSSAMALRRGQGFRGCVHQWFGLKRWNRRRMNLGVRLKALVAHPDIVDRPIKRRSHVGICYGCGGKGECKES